MGWELMRWIGILFLLLVTTIFFWVWVFRYVLSSLFGRELTRITFRC